MLILMLCLTLLLLLLKWRLKRRCFIPRCGCGYSSAAVIHPRRCGRTLDRAALQVQHLMPLSGQPLHILGAQLGSQLHLRQCAAHTS
jgi:hypothetical protein